MGIDSVHNILRNTFPNYLKKIWTKILDYLNYPGKVGDGASFDCI